MYAASGLISYGTIGVDLGTRFGWKDEGLLGHRDFSIGCQYWGGITFVPYVGIGAEFTSYAVGAVVGTILLLVCSVL